MSFPTSKCQSCKKYRLIDEAPWAVCEPYPDGCANIFFQNTAETFKPIQCKYYEYNPDWDPHNFWGTKSHTNKDKEK